jgi:hypothetical protein
MVAKLRFENKTMETLGIIVEPEAVNFDLEVGKSLEVELNYEADQSGEKLDIVMENGRMIIYQNRCAMRIYVDRELQYW